MRRFRFFGKLTRVNSNPRSPGSTWPPRLVRPPGAQCTSPASWSSSTGPPSSAPAAPRRWPPGPGPCRRFCFAVPQELCASSRFTASCSRRCTVVRDTPKSLAYGPEALPLPPAAWPWRPPGRRQRFVTAAPGSSPRPWPSPSPALVRRLTACISCSAAQAMKVVRISPMTASGVSWLCVKVGDPGSFRLGH